VAVRACAQRLSARRSVTLVAVLLAATLAGCGDKDDDTAAVRISSRTVMGPVYFEGALKFVALRDEHGDRALREELDESASLSWRLAPGRYRLTAWARPCSGNCGSLDDPVDGCAATVTLTRERERSVRIVFTAGEPCRVTLR
jgi:hypothetical protein